MRYLLFLLAFNVQAYQVIDLDESMPNFTVYVKWDDGRANCIIFQTSTGIRFDTPPSTDGETTQDYIDRVLPKSDGTLREGCDRLSAKNNEVWLVHQVGDTKYRPLYRLLSFSKDAKEQIGTIPTLTPCGAHIAPVSARIKALEWREVGGGVSVCKRQ